MTVRELVATFTVPGEPVSKERPRVVRGHTYTPAKTLAAEVAVRVAFIRENAFYKPDDTSAYEIEATFHNGTRRRRDLDNMLKLIMDALNGIAWADDYQVTEIHGRKVYAGKKDIARTVVHIYRVGAIAELYNSTAETYIRKRVGDRRGVVQSG